MDEIALIRALTPLGEKPDAPDRGAARQALQARIEAASTGSSSRPSRSRQRRLLTLGAAAALAGLAAAVLLVIGGGSPSPTPAYGAELMDFAESTPLVLLQAPGWQVRNLHQESTGSGKMEFGPASPAPPEAQISRGTARERMARRSPGWRKVELSWREDNKSADQWLTRVEAAPKAHGFITEMPVLGTVAYVDPEEGHTLPEAAGRHPMNATWREGQRILELSAWVHTRSAFRTRLSWLHHVDAETWLGAMPSRVVKAADYGAEVQALLKGVPLPPGFDPAKVPDLHLTTNRYSIGKVVGGAVACGWFRRWYEASARHHSAGARKARGVLLGAGSWPVFQKIDTEGHYPALVDEFARALPSDRFGHERALRPIINHGCSAIGFPIGDGKSDS